jgi:hypothetical protein
MPYTFSRATLPIALLTLTLFGAALSSQSGAHRISNAVPDIARPLPLGAVRLTGGPLKQAQDLDAKYLLALEPDRMLAFYRKRAALEPKAPPYGGWDGDDRNLTGHIAGHHLSAISIMWQATGDARFKQRVDYPESSESRFFDVEYRIPPGFVRGRQKVSVRFEAANGSETAAVFGIRIIRLDG